jgi:hypothetical protein
MAVGRTWINGARKIGKMDFSEDPKLNFFRSNQFLYNLFQETQFRRFSRKLTSMATK